LRHGAPRCKTRCVEEINVSELINLSCGHRPIDLNKLVFKSKRNETGDIVKHKTRPVSMGYAQQAGIDYDNALLRS
jgi:hypothetical protein